MVVIYSINIKFEGSSLQMRPRQVIEFAFWEFKKKSDFENLADDMALFTISIEWVSFRMIVLIKLLTVYHVIILNFQNQLS